MPLNGWPWTVVVNKLGQSRERFGESVEKLKVVYDDPSSNRLIEEQMVESFFYHANFRVVTKPSGAVPKLGRKRNKRNGGGKGEVTSAHFEDETKLGALSVMLVGIEMRRYTQRGK